MALFIDSRWVARDATGAAYSGALLYVYEAGGLTPADLFADSALDPGSPLTNPVVADSNGRFAQVFIAAGTYDCVLKTSGGTTLASYEDVDALGDTAGAFTRNFVNSRVSISGSGGVVSIEFRPPSGDDIGGSGRLGGSNGTQADDIEIDAAESNFTGNVDVDGGLEVNTAKELTEAGKRLTEVLQTEPTAFTAASTVSIELPETPANTRAWEVTIYDLVLSAAESLAFRIAYDAVPTFKSGASDYAFSIIYNNGGTITVATDDAHTHLRASQSLQAASTWPATVKLLVTTVDSGNGNTNLSGRVMGAKTNAGAGAMPANEHFDGAGLGNYGRATFIQLLTLTGGATLTGKYNVKALRGYGE